METVKRPEVLLSAFAAATAVGSGAYSYRRMNTITNELSQVSTQLRNAVNRINNHDSHRGMIEELEKILDSLQSITNKHQESITEIEAHLQQQSEREVARDQQIQKINSKLSRIESSLRFAPESEEYYQPNSVSPPSPKSEYMSRGPSSNLTMPISDQYYSFNHPSSEFTSVTEGSGRLINQEQYEERRSSSKGALARLREARSNHHYTSSYEDSKHDNFFESDRRHSFPNQGQLSTASLI